MSLTHARCLHRMETDGDAGEFTKTAAQQQAGDEPGSPSLSDLGDTAQQQVADTDADATLCVPFQQGDRLIWVAQGTTTPFTGYSSLCDDVFTCEHTNCD